MDSRKEIEALFSKYVLYWNSHDMEKWSGLFTDNTVFITWSGVKYASNRENLQEHTKAHKVLAEQEQPTNYELRNLDIQFLTEEMAIVYAEWIWKGFKAITATEDRTGILTMVLQKIQGGWKIRTTQNTRTDKNIRSC